jgi:hypothetical protein
MRIASVEDLSNNYTYPWRINGRKNKGKTKENQLTRPGAMEVAGVRPSMRIAFVEDLTTTVGIP